MKTAKSSQVEIPKQVCYKHSVRKMGGLENACEIHNIDANKKSKGRKKLRMYQTFRENTPPKLSMKQLEKFKS